MTSVLVTPSCSGKAAGWPCANRLKPLWFSMFSGGWRAGMVKL